MPNDARLMDAVIGLARRGLGRTSPNPSVAALVVRFDQGRAVIVGRGVTGRGGRPHAEPQAIEQAGALAKGASLYVTLEPCARRSRSTDDISCTDVIIKAGIARVVIGAADPSPFASGEGIARLRKAGIDVVVGVQADAALQTVQGHILRVQDHRPLVSLKLARTADGFAGTLTGAPIAITGPVSFLHTHLARAQADALMVGIGTILGDDPKLNCRLPGLEDQSPVRIVLDGALRIPLDAFIVRDARHIPTWVFCSETADEITATALRRRGVEVTPVASRGGRLDLREVLSVLSARGITRLMVEGGPCLANALAAQDLIDEVTVMTGPVTASTGIAAIGPDLQAWMDREHLSGQTRWGQDIVAHYERHR